jgi:cytochrome c-type biogenesis protein
MTTPEQTIATPTRDKRSLLLVVGLVLLAGAALLVLPTTDGTGNLLALAPLAFIAGLLSFLSPCCLPVLSAYFAYTFQTSRERVLGATIAFFLGVATTMVLLGASATAISGLIFSQLDTLTTIGGLLIIVFGVMSMLGKGFSGPQLAQRSRATTWGAYIYGATFALGWTACVGPILGALLTLLATQGIAVLQGAALSFIYALGLGTPLIIVATSFSRLGPGSPVWRVLRGRGFTLNLGFTTLYLHSTSLISGLLLIVMGTMLLTGQLTRLSAWAVQLPMTRWVLDIESSLRALFAGSL